MQQINEPVENASFFEHISQIDVSIQEIWIELYGFLKMMYCKPYFTLRVENAAQIRPSNRKLRLCFDCFQVANLKHILWNSRRYDLRTALKNTKKHYLIQHKSSLQLLISLTYCYFFFLYSLNNSNSSPFKTFQLYNSSLLENCNEKHTSIQANWVVQNKAAISYITKPILTRETSRI